MELEKFYDIRTVWPFFYRYYRILLLLKIRDSTKPIFYSKFVANIWLKVGLKEYYGIFTVKILSRGEKKDKNKVDCFRIMSSCLDVIRSNFQRYWNYHQDIDVDEQVIPAKCYNSVIQYNRHKFYEWFWKVYSQNDWMTSYMHNFCFVKRMKTG